MPIDPVSAGLAGAQALFGLYQTLKGRKELKNLDKNKPEGFTITPELQKSYARAEQMAQDGYTPQKEAAFQANLERQSNAAYNRSFAFGGNTMAVSLRSESYVEFKKRKGEKLLDELEKNFPNIRSCIKSYTCSTSLSYRDYIGTKDGSMYGILKDHKDPLRTFISPKTKVPNLYLTGQNLNMRCIGCNHWCSCYLFRNTRNGLFDTKNKRSLIYLFFKVRIRTFISV